jgi:hypothetical protein
LVPQSIEAQKRFGLSLRESDRLMKDIAYVLGTVFPMF